MDNGIRQGNPRSFAWLLLLFTLFSPALAPAEDRPARKFDFMMGTNVKAPEGGVVKAEVVDGTLHQWGDALVALKDRLEKPNWRRGPVVAMYLPSDMTTEEVAAVEREALTEFQRAFPESEPHFVPHFVDKELNKIERLAEGMEEAIHQAARETGDTELAQQMLRLAKSVKDEAKKQKGIIERVQTPQGARQLKKTVGRMRGGIILFSQLQQMVQGMLVPETAFWKTLGAGLMLAATDSTFEYYTLAYMSEIQTWYRDHLIPHERLERFLKFMAPAWRNRIVGVTKFVNTASWNAAVNYARTMLSQAAGNVVNPHGPQNRTGIRPVQAEDELLAAINILIGTGPFAASRMGFDALYDGGWMTKQQIDVAGQMLGLFDVVSYFLMRNPAIREQFAWTLTHMTAWDTTAPVTILATQVPVWAMYMVIFATGMILPPRVPNYVIVERSLGNRADIDGLEATSGTRKMAPTDAAYATFLADTKDYKAAGGHWCRSFLAWMGCRFRRG